MMSRTVAGVIVSCAVATVLGLLFQTVWIGEGSDHVVPTIIITTGTPTYSLSTLSPNIVRDTAVPFQTAVAAPTRSVELFGQSGPGDAPDIGYVTFGYNPKGGRCPHDVQPNRTRIPSAGCPVPGLNNILYTQHNKWYCAYRDNTMIHLRDRICSKGTKEYFRFSTILQVNYNKSKRGTLCWSDVKHGHDKSPTRCTWDDIPRFYGTSQWWEARRLIDFHPHFYRYAEDFVRQRMGGDKFLAMHLRRGDYHSHCVVMKRKHEPPWMPFRHTKNEVTKLSSFVTACYPSLELIQKTINDLTAKHSLRFVFISSNSKEFTHVNFTRGLRDGLTVVMFSPPPMMRAVDTIIIDMALLSLSHVSIFNRFSSLSATAFEMMYIHDRWSADRMWVW